MRWLSAFAMYLVGVILVGAMFLLAWFAFGMAAGIVVYSAGCLAPAAGIYFALYGDTAIPRDETWRRLLFCWIMVLLTTFPGMYLALAIVSLITGTHI